MVKLGTQETHLEWGHNLLRKLVNRIMLEGKKNVAERILMQAFNEIRTRAKDDPYRIALASINNVRPYVEIKSIRVAGSTYMVPVEISEKRQISLALKWIVDNARGRNERQMHQRLASELIDAYNRVGSSIRKKEELHKMAEANRAFAHYRW